MEFFTSESLGIIGIGLIIVGIIKFVYYYKSFNVSILRYIEASEIVTLFADNSTIAGGALLVLIPPYLYSILPQFQDGAGNSIAFMQGCLFKERLATYWLLLWPHIVYQLPIGLAFILFTITRKSIFRFERIRYACLMIALLFLEFATPELIFHTYPSFKPSVIISLILVLNFLIMILVATSNEIDKVKHHGFFKTTVVEFEDNDFVKLSADSYFVGKVKSFIFFYDPSNKKSLTISTSKLKSIAYTPYIPLPLVVQQNTPTVSQPPSND